MKNKNLHNIKSSGFKIPEDYFDTLEKKVLNKIDGGYTLKNIKSNSFKVPENYFDTIESRITERLSEEDQDTKVISLINKKTVIYISSIAAAILILFNLTIFDNHPSFDNLETETVENYILDENISSYEMASLFSTDLLNESDFVEHDFDEENLKEYLLNNADIEALITE
jgi:hypothetical protein